MKDVFNQIRGFVDYYRAPGKREAWGGAFNGQEFRRSIFLELVEKFDFSSIFETGTFRGTTTEFMASRSRAIVYTVEANPRNYGFCQARFRHNSQVRLSRGDSRSFLRAQLTTAQSGDKPAFCYLDAHWYADLPLLDECRIILASAVPTVIMIDDFEVKDDPGYAFDDYGDGKRLALEYLEPLAQHEVSVFFPNCPSERETGARRGCVVLCGAPRIEQVLHTVRTLKEFREWSATKRSSAAAL
jgi:hypothetical protein